MDPFVSVIMCNYNYCRFIAEAIDSVLNQTFTNFEFIIVDDGSTDDSREVISSFQDSRIRPLFQKNGGQAVAFNAGFKIARGGIIAFLDSDDWWKPKKLETVVKWHYFLDGDYSVLQHGLDLWDEGKTNPYKNILPVGDCFAEMKRTNNIDFFVATSGLVFTGAVLKKVFPLPERMRICADGYMMRAAFVFGKVCSIPCSLGFYRKHENNAVMQNKEFDMHKYLWEILFPELNKFYQSNNVDYQIPVERVPGRRGALRLVYRLGSAASKLLRK
jgi:glycosyltransferase involved in cell wall biosynthesis